MCGLSGFFVGCEFAKKCLHGKKSCGLARNPMAMRRWEESASVRTKPLRTLNEDDFGKHLFPRELVPVLRHPLLQGLGGEEIIDLLSKELARYLDFTIKLESCVVNDVARDIAIGHSVFTPDASLIADAWKVYTDEAFHALFSANLLNQVAAHRDVASTLPDVPRFMLSVRDLLRDTSGIEEEKLAMLMVVTSSETLITASLSDIKRSKDLPEAVSQTVADHAADEGRHHAFFAGLLFSVWEELEPSQKVFALRVVPKAIMAFVSPDEQAIGRELKSVGISADATETILRETYTTTTVTEYARNSARSLLSYVRELPESSLPEVRDVFEQEGLML